MKENTDQWMELARLIAAEDLKKLLVLSKNLMMLRKTARL
jgi:hypothetical protein